AWPGAHAVSPATVAATQTGWRLPAIWLSVLLFFVYTGVEATAGQWPYTLFTEGRAIPAAVAGSWVGLYWASLTGGRVLFGFVANRVPPVVLLRLGMLGVLVGSALIWLHPTEELGFAGLVLMGFAAAPIFPSLIAATPMRLGAALAAGVIGFEVAASSLGIGLMPGLAGLLAQRLGLEAIGPFLFAAG